MKSLTFVIIAIFASTKVYAVPDFTKAIGLEDPTSITVYGDNTDPNQYYAPPSTVELAVAEDGTPSIGFVHWGIVAPSIAGGIGGNLQIAVKPVIDTKLLPSAWTKIKEKNPAAKISPLVPDVAYMDLVLGSALFDKLAGSRVRQFLRHQERKEAVKAKVATDGETTDADAAHPVAVQPAPDAAQPATAPRRIEIEDLEGVVVTTDDDVTVINDPNVASTGLAAQIGSTQTFALSLIPDAAAVFATNGGESASNFGVRYRYRVLGIRSRVKAEITVNWGRLYTHFHHEGGGGWFSFRAAHAIDLQNLKETGAIKLNIIEGGFESPEDEFNTIYMQLVAAHINGKGLFAPTLSATAPPGAPKTDGTFFGWSGSSATSYQSLKEENDFTYVIDRQILGKKMFEVGMAFQGMCAKYPQKFVAQGHPESGCITSANLQGAVKRYAKLRDTCEKKTMAEREARWAALKLLPENLQRIALEKEYDSLARFTYDCMNGK